MGVGRVVGGVDGVPHPVDLGQEALVVAGDRERPEHQLAEGGEHVAGNGAGLGRVEVYERGLVEWDDEKKQFEKVTAFDLKAPAHPGGHTILRRVDGTRYVYFATPYPLVRVRADPDDLKRIDR